MSYTSGASQRVQPHQYIAHAALRGGMKSALETVLRTPTSPHSRKNVGYNHVQSLRVTMYNIPKKFSLQIQWLQLIGGSCMKDVSKIIIYFKASWSDQHLQ